jgi:hypothetical protein
VSTLDRQLELLRVRLALPNPSGTRERHLRRTGMYAPER